MAKTFLVLGPAGAGKTSLVRVLAGEHPDHCWHLVRLESHEDGSSMQPLRVDAPHSIRSWLLRYVQADAPKALAGAVQQIASESPDSRTIIAFESTPDPVLRCAFGYDLRVFVLPPIRDETVVFRTAGDSKRVLQQILRDTSTFSAGTAGLAESQVDELGSTGHPLGPPPHLPEAPELRESQVERFLACPLGMELAARVHFQPDFDALADSDLVILNTAAGESLCESDTCWHKIQAMLARLHKPAGKSPLTYACDLVDLQDPMLVRILRRIGESLCRV